VSFAVDGTSALNYKEELIKSYNVGQNSEFLKIRSAEDKGRNANKSRFIDKALQFPYIAPNSNFNVSWLVFDIDREFNPIELENMNISYPNYVVYNPENGHAHLWYQLKNPVYCQDNFKASKPYKYYKAVYKALRKALGADEHFGGKLCKNPLHPQWKSIQLSNSAYSLSELSAHLDLNWKEDKKPGKKKAHVDINIVGEFGGVEKGSRNSSLFDFCRHKAYLHRMTADCSEADFVEWCVELVREADKSNPNPIGTEYKGEQEIRQIGESIGYWTWANLEPSIIKKEKYDDAAREKSLKTRQTKAAKKLRKIEKYLKKHPDASNREISRVLGEGFSTDTVNKAVKKIIEARKAKAEKSRADAAAVVGIVPVDDGLGERFVNQVVSPVGALAVAVIIRTG